MSKEIRREKNVANWDRYTTKTKTHAERERKEKTLVGRTVKEIRRVTGKTIDQVAECVNPTPDPWEDDNWMVM